MLPRTHRKINPVRHLVDASGWRWCPRRTAWRELEPAAQAGSTAVGIRRPSSPDGQRIVYVQFDQSGVPEFALINYTDTLYPVITTYPYPKAGQTNAAVRIGVVSAAGGPTRWMKAPGDPRNTSIARMAWAGNSNEVILPHLNRPQNTNTVLLADAGTGNVRQMFRDQDEAWVDHNDDFVWLEEGKRLLFVSERDGWRHAYAVSRDGDTRLITTGAFDLMSVAGVDHAGGWVYDIASPTDATQRYVYRSRLDGGGVPERVTPAGASGTHTYTLSPDCRWAFHSDSRFDMPGQSDVIRLPEHQVVRVFQTNAELKAKVAPMLAGRTEMFQVDIGEGVTIDGWLIRPRTFDASKKYPIIINVLNKQFSFMEYPNRRHGIGGLHLDTLRYGFFEQHLPAGGR